MFTGARQRGSKDGTWGSDWILGRRRRPDAGAEATAGCRGRGGGGGRRRWSEAAASRGEADSRLASDGKPSRPLRSWSLSAWKMKGMRLRSSGWWAAKWPNNLTRGRLARDKLVQEKAQDPAGNVGCESRPQRGGGGNLSESVSHVSIAYNTFLVARGNFWSLALRLFPFCSVFEKAMSGWLPSLSRISPSSDPYPRSKLHHARLSQNHVLIIFSYS